MNLFASGAAGGADDFDEHAPGGRGRSGARERPAVAALAAIAAGAALGLAGGCLKLSDKPEFEPMCFQTSDCDQAAGEICDGGICWGDPPAAVFAAVLDPPGEVADGAPALVSTELPELAIARDGAISGLTFEPHVTLRGRVLVDCDSAALGATCDPDTSIAATIRVRRPSRIPGLPPYTQQVVARDGRGPGEVGFELRLPATGDDPPYEITVLPDDGSLSEGPVTGPVPSELAPPLRIAGFVATDDASDLEFRLGDATAHRLVTGRVVDAALRGLPGLRVYALGRWSPETPLERGSSTATTDSQGAFALRVPIGMVDEFEFVAEPTADNAAPTLTIAGVPVPDPAAGDTDPVDIGNLQMPAFLVPAAFSLPVQGVDSSGVTVPVAEAAVGLVTFFDTGDPAVKAFYEEKTHTDASGRAQVKLIPGSGGNRPYLLHVAPAPTSEHAAVYAATVVVPPVGGGILPAVMLRRRVPLTGRLTADGAPVEGATVTAQPSLGFRLGLEDEPRRALETFQFASTTTAADGGFVLWADDDLVGAAATYDIELVPSQPLLPQWSVRGVTAASLGAGGNVDLGAVALPEAAYARGTVRAPDGTPVVGARLRLFELTPDAGPCADLSLPGAGEGCVPPPIARGVRRSEDGGFVMVVLPDP